MIFHCNVYNEKETEEMGKQYNKVQKRARLKRYIERQKAKVRAAMKPAKKK